MPVHLDPSQPEPVVRAIERLLGHGRRRVDPWWAAGVSEGLRGGEEERLRGGDGPPAQDAGGGAGVVEA